MTRRMRVRALSGLLFEAQVEYVRCNFSNASRNDCASSDSGHRHRRRTSGGVVNVP